MASFEREVSLVKLLLAQLSWDGTVSGDPNAAGQETGIDVSVRASDGRTIGIQVTEVDPYAVPGLARGREKAIANTQPEKPCFMWGQSDPSVVVNAIERAINRKVEIAAKHPFDGYDEVWLLLCAGIPEHGTVVSTFVMTPWLSGENMNAATDSLLQGSNYDGCFMLPILGAEQAYYSWSKSSRWEKRVQQGNSSDIPRQAYIDSLMAAAAARTSQEVDRLTEDECRASLAELLQK